MVQTAGFITELADVPIALRLYLSRQNVGSYVWTISDVDRRRTESSRNATVHSPCFYTSQTGYKLCLRVNLNGVDSGVDRFIAVFVHVNRGAFDAIIDWPFAGTAGTALCVIIVAK